MELKQDLFAVDDQQTKRESDLAKSLHTDGNEQPKGVVEVKDKEDIVIELQDSTVRKFTNKTIHR